MKSFLGFNFKRKGKKGSRHQSKSSSNGSISGKSSFSYAVSKEEVGRKKRRLVVNHLLEMTLDHEMETSLLWNVAKGFDLPLVIGEQFICTVKGEYQPTCHENESIPHRDIEKLVDKFQYLVQYQFIHFHGMLADIHPEGMTFQSASYTACLEYILTTLYMKEEQFAVDIWDKLIHKLNNDSNQCVKKCQLALHGFSCETRKSHFHEYKNCFVGKQAVSWLVENRICVSQKPREEAVQLGNEWIRKGYIKHVDEKGTRHFGDEKGVFFRFDEKMILKELREINENLYDPHQPSPQQIKGTPSSSYINKDIIAYHSGKTTSTSPIKKKLSFTIRDYLPSH